MDQDPLLAIFSKWPLESAIAIHLNDELISKISFERVPKESLFVLDINMKLGQI